MRNKLYKAITTMAVAGLLLTSCGSPDAQNTDNAPKADVDLAGFLELKPVQDNLIAHDWYAYNGVDGKARRASLTVQEMPNGGYTEARSKTEFMRILAKDNGGEEVSEAEYKKAWNALIKRQSDGYVYFVVDSVVEKLDDGSEEDEPRAWDGEMQLFFQIDQQCDEPSVNEIPFENGCLVGKTPGAVDESNYRKNLPEWVGRDGSPYESGASDVLTEVVSRTVGGVAFEATGDEQDMIRNPKQVFAAYDLEEGGGPIGALPNFACAPGSAGQAILDAYKAESDAEGGIAQRYISFAPEDAGCTMEPVAVEENAQ
ncbi:hypothetical protein [Glutamicibacter ardleyensis]|uniref:hypothetical protein n=1 Tax=Glutamicibacter ardleyensis TaxID=225894 RepID=UPI003FD53756